MKALGMLFSVIVAILPMLWINDYVYTNPIWWTVMGAWFFGRMFGWIESEEF